MIAHHAMDKDLMLKSAALKLEFVNDAAVNGEERTGPSWG